MYCYVLRVSQPYDAADNSQGNVGCNFLKCIITAGIVHKNFHYGLKGIVKPYFNKFKGKLSSEQSN